MKGEKERFASINFIAENQIFVQAFENLVTFGLLEPDRRLFKELSRIVMETDAISSFDILEGNIALGLWSGHIMLIKVFISKMETVMVKISEKAIKNIKFLGNGNFLTIADTENLVLLVRLKNFMNSTTKWFAPEFDVFRIYHEKEIKKSEEELKIIENLKIEKEKQKKIEERKKRLKKSKKLRKAGSMVRTNSYISSDGTSENEDIEESRNPSKDQKLKNSTVTKLDTHLNEEEEEEKEFEVLPIVASHILEFPALEKHFETFVYFDDDGFAHVVKLPKIEEVKEASDDKIDEYNYMSYLRTHTVRKIIL